MAATCTHGWVRSVRFLGVSATELLGSGAPNAFWSFLTVCNAYPCPKLPGAHGWDGAPVQLLMSIVADARDRSRSGPTARPWPSAQRPGISFVAMSFAQDCRLNK